MENKGTEPYNIDLSILSVSEKLDLITKKCDQYLKLKSDYLKKEKYFIEQRMQLLHRIETIKSDKCSKSDTYKLRIKLKVKSNPHLRHVVFKVNQFWIDTLLEYYDCEINLLNTYISKQPGRINHLKNFCREIGHEPPEYEPKEVKELNKVNTCCTSILPCDRHLRKPTHRKEFINESLLSQIQPGCALGVDVECVQKIYTEHKPKPKGMTNKCAIRVSAVVSIRDRLEYLNPQVVYHSFWYPKGNFHVFKWLTGLSKQEIVLNHKKFVVRDSARTRFLNKIAKNHTLVFAAVKEDLQAMEINKNTESYCDIQDYYTRFPSFRAPSPVSLQLLAKIVLQTEIQKGVHDPTIDACITLNLYNKIPEEIKKKITVIKGDTTNLDQYRSMCQNSYCEWPQPSTSNTQVLSAIPQFIDNFEPDFEPDLELSDESDHEVFLKDVF